MHFGCAATVFAPHLVVLALASLALHLLRQALRIRLIAEHAATFVTIAPASATTVAAAIVRLILIVISLSPDFKPRNAAHRQSRCRPVAGRDAATAAAFPQFNKSHR